MFTCLNGNQSIPWSGVNNDVCDCADGSDEPGTSACNNGRLVGGTVSTYYKAV